MIKYLIKKELFHLLMIFPQKENLFQPMKMSSSKKQKIGFMTFLFTIIQEKHIFSKAKGKSFRQIELKKYQKNIDGGKNRNNFKINEIQQRNESY